MNGRVLAVVAVAGVLLLGGCATGTGGGVAPGGPAEVGSPSPSASFSPKPIFPITDAAVLEYCPDVPSVHFDGDTSAVSEIYVCSATTIAHVDDTTGALPIVQRASRVVAGGDELLAAYAVPDSADVAEACPAMMADPLIIWLHRAAGTSAVYAPIGSCPFPTDAAVAAYNAVTLETVAEGRTAAESPPADPGK
ncbi:MAG: hypothetical protein H7146_07485 [Burkholderiaceae bacterium]|nr:hypothetical protein [Microbacteriaceae bacterium]